MGTLVKAITADGSARITAADTTDIVARAREIHHTTAVATAALGRLLTGASIIGSLQKIDEGSVTLIIRGGGPLGTIMAVADDAGNPRGYVDNPQVALMEKHSGKLDVGGAVGSSGTLTLIRDLHMKDPYVGTVALQSGEIAEDIAAYYVESEQVPTACALGVLLYRDQTVDAAGGYLLQLMPGAKEETVSQLEAAINEAGAVTGMLKAGLTPKGIIRRIFSGMEIEILEESHIEYRCSCSRRRVESALLSLGRKELTDMIDEGKDISVGCQFCDKSYSFSPKDLKGILAEGLSLDEDQDAGDAAADATGEADAADAEV